MWTELLTLFLLGCTGLALWEPANIYFRFNVPIWLSATCFQLVAFLGPWGL